MSLKFVLRPSLCRVFVISQHRNALLFHPSKELGRVAFPIKDDAKAAKQRIGLKFLLAGLAGGLGSEPWHNVVLQHVQQSGIDSARSSAPPDPAPNRAH